MVTLEVCGYEIVRENDTNYLHVRFEIKPDADTYNKLNPQAHLIHRQFTQGNIVHLGLEEEIQFIFKNKKGGANVQT